MPKKMRANEKLKSRKLIIKNLDSNKNGIAQTILYHFTTKICSKLNLTQL